MQGSGKHGFSDPCFSLKHASFFPGKRAFFSAHKESREKYSEIALTGAEGLHTMYQLR